MSEKKISIEICCTLVHEKNEIEETENQFSTDRTRKTIRKQKRLEWGPAGRGTDGSTEQTTVYKARDPRNRRGLDGRSSEIEISFVRFIFKCKLF